MSRRVERVLITGQEIVILLKAKPIVAKGVLVVIRVNIVNPNFINRTEALLEESQWIGAK